MSRPTGAAQRISGGCRSTHGIRCLRTDSKELSSEAWLAVMGRPYSPRRFLCPPAARRGALVAECPVAGRLRTPPATGTGARPPGSRARRPGWLGPGHEPGGACRQSLGQAHRLEVTWGARVCCKRLP